MDEFQFLQGLLKIRFVPYKEDKEVDWADFMGKKEQKWRHFEIKMAAVCRNDRIWQTPLFDSENGLLQHIKKSAYLYFPVHKNSKLILSMWINIENVCFAWYPTNSVIVDRFIPQKSRNIVETYFDNILSYFSSL